MVGYSVVAMCTGPTYPKDANTSGIMRRGLLLAVSATLLATVVGGADTGRKHDFVRHLAADATQSEWT